jgi:NDP-sugar pyrophosphorylase family protein
VKGAVLAAGWGERLKEGGVATPKPLVRVAGRPLVLHALAALADAGADEALLVVNEGFADGVEAALAAEPPALPVELVRRTTASSLETFSVAAAQLRDAPCALVAMVDGVFAAGAATGFGRAAATLPAAEGLIGVTDRPDEDEPLRVAFDAERRISAIGRGAEGSAWSTAGLYRLPRRAFERAPGALAEGLGALRALLGELAHDRPGLRAYPLGLVIDVDRPDDLGEAERLGSAS